MRVRAALAADVPALIPLIERYWEFERITGFDAARIATLLAGLFASPAQGAVWVAEEGTAFSGYLILVLVLSLEHQGIMGEIDELYVGAAARSQGTGAALLAAAERHLKAHGGVRLQLQLGADNCRAGEFYRRHGFTPRAGFALWDKAL